jgi:hypothetical protein
MRPRDVGKAVAIVAADPVAANDLKTHGHALASKPAQNGSSRLTCDVPRRQPANRISILNCQKRMIRGHPFWSRLWSLKGRTRTTPEICGFVPGTLDLSGYRIVLIPPCVQMCPNARARRAWQPRIEPATPILALGEEIILALSQTKRASRVETGVLVPHSPL